jgi:hypothetical protein
MLELVSDLLQVCKSDPRDLLPTMGRNADPGQAIATEPRRIFPIAWKAEKGATHLIRLQRRKSTRAVSKECGDEKSSETGGGLSIFCQRGFVLDHRLASIIQKPPEALERKETSDGSKASEQASTS